MIIAVDFDGTVVEHKFPAVGRDVPFAEGVLKRLVKNGHKIILFTMRSGKHLQDAIDWFTSKHIPLFGVNQNPEQYIWTSSPKAYAHIYIDDAAIGIPLTEVAEGRPYVSWLAVRELLRQRGCFKNE